ncbi:hypothetical protein DH2020_044575 [Rehmannia glutinosa]|uniref:Uncharacterized protein n=1 Tax=Rehmannia glutinosa TaxID=99300 RepID=A0ABR0UHB8_REHGL
MSILCCLPVLECVYCLACTRWAYKRCLHNAAHDSETWAHATSEEFEPVPRLCKYILAVYEDDLNHPHFEPLRGFRINPECLIMKKNYKDTRGKSPPYLIYLDHDHADIVLAIRGLNLAKESDYAVLLDNKLGKRKFDGGYVHNGLLKAAGWILNAECDVLKEMVEKYPNYTLTFTGHSLGSGVAALMTILVVQNRERLGNIERKRVRCYSIAPARCMSLNLAVRYADVINSVVLQASLLRSCLLIKQGTSLLKQDDFLPRTATPLEDIFKSLFWSDKALSALSARPKSLIVLSGRPKLLILAGRPKLLRFLSVGRSSYLQSAKALKIYRSAQSSLVLCSHSLMRDKDHMLEIPAKQKMERQKTIAKETQRRAQGALHRVITLAVPHAFSPFEYGTFDEKDDDDDESKNSIGDSSTGSTTKDKSKEDWDELIERLFERDESGHMVVKKTLSD